MSSSLTIVLLIIITSSLVSSFSLRIKDGNDSQFVFLTPDKVVIDSQRGSASVQGSAKIATGQSGALSPTSCQLIEAGWSTAVEIFTNNPTGDDTYSINAVYFPNAQQPAPGECQISGDSCYYASGAPCFPPGQSESYHKDMFNVTSCGDNSALIVIFGCIDTPGAFNDHCEIDYTVDLLYYSFVNSTDSFEALCLY